MTKKHNLIAILLIACGLFVSITACSDDTVDDTYKAWRELNEKWMVEQMLLTNPDGTPFYNQVTMPTDPKNVIFMHSFGEVNEQNLKPLYTSTTKVNYTLTLANDSVLDKGTGFVSQLNSPNLISGWSLSVMQLHVGDSAQFLVPYASGYGASGNEMIPPYTNLQFNVKLVDITAYEIRP